MTTATPYATGDNAGFVEDKNGNGRIDAIDLLDDVNWADGRDTDGNSFFDDLFGVNFRSGAMIRFRATGRWMNSVTARMSPGPSVRSATTVSAWSVSIGKRR